MAKLKTKESLSQELNPPIILNLSIREAEVVKKYQIDKSLSSNKVICSGFFIKFETSAP